MTVAASTATAASSITKAPPAIFCTLASTRSARVSARLPYDPKSGGYCTCAWYNIAGMAMLPTAENPVKNLPASIHLQHAPSMVTEATL